MGKDRKGLQLLDGFRHSGPDSPHTRANGHPRPHQKAELPCSHFLEPRQDDLVSALKAMEQRLSTLLTDRSRIGQDLHDSVLQSLYAIGLHIETAHRTAPSHTPETDRSHKGIVEQIDRLIHEIRQMIRELNEGVVQEFDLAVELRALKATYNQIGRMRITLDLQPAAIEVLTKEEEREILNIVREALSNCVRHAHATHAAISIRKLGAKIRVDISDDGTGLALGDGRPLGYGLANIKSRAKKIGGTLRVRSEEARGTQLLVEFSLEPMLAPV